MHQQVGDALFGQAHLPLALKGEGLGDDAHRQDAQVVGHLGHHGVQDVGDLILALLGGALAHLGVCAGAAALGQLGAQLHLDGGVVLGQGLLVGVEGDELHPLHPVGHHPVDGVAAAAAHAHHFDGRNVFVHLFIKHQSHSFVPPSGKYGHCTAAGQGSRPPRSRADNSGFELYKFILSSFGSDCKVFFLFKVHFFQSRACGGISRQICAPTAASIASKPG